jgi:hypothetical protein
MARTRAAFIREPRQAEHWSPRAVAQTQWIYGYLSGLNFSGAENVDFLAIPDGPAIDAWVKNYCTKNPLDDLKAAASALRYELVSRATKGR